MATVALFHSVLGVRPGVVDAQDRLVRGGHTVHLVDQYGGDSFDDYDVASAYVEEHGSFPPLMQLALKTVEGLPDDLICVGFSNGGGMAEYVATQRPVGGVVMASGTLPLQMLGAHGWPSGVPAQIHYMRDDPFKVPGWAESVAQSVRQSGSALGTFDYDGNGHLFTDPSMTEEYDEAATELFWQRVLAFVADPGATS